MFHVPRTAGGHPRLVMGLLAATVLIGGAGLTGALTSRPLSLSDTAQAATVPVRPPVVVVEALPQLAARLSREAEAGRFMGAVLVARGDEVLFRQVYGTADVATGAPL